MHGRETIHAAFPVPALVTQWQRGKCCYLKMRLDENHYADSITGYWLVRNADKKGPYKDGLNLVNGKIAGSYGGGLCQFSNLLFWRFLHTPLTVIERHGHAVDAFPSTTEDLSGGRVDTVSEGCCDLQVWNDTDNTLIWRSQAEKVSGKTTNQRLYTNQREFTYSLPGGTEIKKE